MPELPDVELYKKYFDRHALHKKVKQVKVLEKKSIRGFTEKDLSRVLANDSFDSTDRYGKWLLVKTSKGKSLAMHFGMTGDLEYVTDGEMPASVRVIFEFSDGDKLLFEDRRKLGGIELINDREELLERHHLGPDAMGISWKEFQARLKGKKGKIKPALMDQSILAGIGNVYADEILFQAKVHPESGVSKLGDKELKAIYNCIKPVLKTAITYQGKRKSFPDNFIIPQRKKGGVCPRCGKSLVEKEVGGRTTYYCPVDQK